MDSMNKLLNQDCSHLYSEVVAALIPFLTLNFQDKQRRIKPIQEGNSSTTDFSLDKSKTSFQQMALTSNHKKDLHLPFTFLDEQFYGT